MTNNSYIRFNDNVLYDIIIDDFELNFQLSDIKNLSEAKTSFSVPIDLPLTPKTVRIFGRIYNTNNISTITRQRIDAKLIHENRCVINGYAYIDLVTTNSIKVVIASSDLTIFEDVQDKVLSDLCLTGSTYQMHTDNQFNMRQAINNYSYSEDNLVDWVTIDWQNKGQLLTQEQKDFNSIFLNRLHVYNRLCPVLKVKTVFDNIISQAGYTYEGSSSFIEKLEKMRMTTDVNESNYTSTATTSYYFHTTVPSGNIIDFKTFGDTSGAKYIPQATYVGKTKVNGYISNVNHNTTNDFDWVYKPYFEDNTEYTITLNVYARLSGSTATTGKTSFSLVRHNPLKSVTNIDGYQLEFDEINVVGTTEKLYTSTITVTTGSDNFYNDGFLLKVEKDSNVILTNYIDQDGKTDCGITITHPSYLYHVNNTFTFNDLLSRKFKQFDLLNDILTMYNISIYADKNDKKHLYFLTQNDFYSDTQILDYSNKISTEDDIEIEDNSKLLSSEYILGFASSDEISENYKTINSTSLYSKKLTNPNYLSSKETNEIGTVGEQGVITDRFKIADIYQNLGISRIEAKPILSHYSSVNGAIIYGFINKIDISNRYLAFLQHPDFINNPVHYEARMFYSTAYLTLSPFLIASTSEQEYSNQNTFSLQFDTSHQYFSALTGVTTTTSNTIFNKFWLNDIDKKLNGNQKVVRTKLKLHASDLNVENFRKRIYIKSSQLGDSYYYLQSIVFPSDTSKLSEVELIKLTNYIPNSSSTAINIIKHDYDKEISSNSSSGGGSSSSSSSSGSVDLSNYVKIPDFNSFSGNTITNINNKLDRSIYQSYTGATKTALNNFVRLSGTTAQTIQGDLNIDGNLYVSGDGVFYSLLPNPDTTSIFQAIPLGQNLIWNSVTGRIDAVGTGVSSWNDLTDKPLTFTPSTHYHSYNDLTDKPVSFSGSYNDLTNKPALFSGDYNALYNKPALFSGNYNDLSNKPDLNSYWNTNTLIANDIEATYITVNGNEVYHQGNFNPADYLPLAGGTLTGNINTASFLTGSDSGGNYIVGKSNLGIYFQYQNAGGNYNTLKITDNLTFNNNTVWHAGNFNPDLKLNIGNYINSSGQADAHRNGSIFAYTGSGTPWDGALLTVGGFETGRYPLQLNSSYSGNHLSFRNHNGDNGTWETWKEIYHSGNLNRTDTDFTARHLYSTQSFFTDRGYHKFELGTDSSAYGFYIYDNTVGQYRLKIDKDNGYLRIADCITDFPGNGVIKLSGNLHIDSYNGYDIYLNYYSNKNIEIYGHTDLNNYNLTGINFLNTSYFRFGDGTQHIYQFGTDSASPAGMYLYDVNRGAYVFRVSDADGGVYFNNEIYSQGAAAGFSFQNRTGSNKYAWFASSDVVNLYNTNVGSILTISSGGSIKAPDFIVSPYNGFQSEYYLTNQINPIWSFSNAPSYGIGYNQSSTDDIRFYFGDKTNPKFTFNSQGNINATGDIDAGGNITAGGEVTAYSDRILKTDLQPITNVLDKIQNINGYYYKRVDLEDKNKQHLGLIAQEVEAYFPELVERNKEGILSLNYQNYVAVLNEAIKEQQKEIKEQKELINNQQKQIDSLIEKVNYLMKINN